MTPTPSHPSIPAVTLMIEEFPTHFVHSGGGVCPHCRHVLPSLEALSGEYFEGREICCRNSDCGRPVDLWEATVADMRRPGASFFRIISLGAKSTMFQTDFASRETKEIDLTQYGVPAEATILNVNFTPYGVEGGASCLPLLVHGNTAYPRSVGTKFWVYARPNIGVPEGVARVGISVKWVSDDSGCVSWVYLVDAFEALSAQRYWSVVVPSYVAFEIGLMPLVREALERFASSERVRAFVRNDLSSSSALNILLPTLCGLVGAPLLPAAIRGELNRAREVRNDLVHKGVAKTAVDEKTAAVSLCASIFGLEYINYIRPRLIP